MRVRATPQRQNGAMRGSVTRLRAVKRTRGSVGIAQKQEGAQGAARREEAVHFSASIRCAGEDDDASAQEAVRDALANGLCEGGDGVGSTVSCVALQDKKTVLLTADYVNSEACLVHFNDRVMPLFEKLEVEKLLASFDEECNADEHAKDCEGEAISMAMYTIGADGKIGPCA